MEEIVKEREVSFQSDYGGGSALVWGEWEGRRGLDMNI